MINPELESLTQELMRGDSNRLARYLELQQGKLLAFIDRRLGTALRRKVEPEDIWQETSLEAVRSVAEVDLSQRDPLSWLFQVAERRIIDAHRKFFGSQKRAADREQSLFGGPADAPSNDLINLLAASFTTASQMFSRNHREHRLIEALASLPEIQREALRLRYMEGLASKDVAEKLGKTDGAVRVMLTRALDKLQEILGQEPEA